MNGGSTVGTRHAEVGHVQVDALEAVAVRAMYAQQRAQFVVARGKAERAVVLDAAPRQRVAHLRQIERDLLIQKVLDGVTLVEGVDEELRVDRVAVRGLDQLVARHLDDHRHLRAGGVRGERHGHHRERHVAQRDVIHQHVDRGERLLHRRLLAALLVIAGAMQDARDRGVAHFHLQRMKRAGRLRARRAEREDVRDFLFLQQAIETA